MGERAAWVPGGVLALGCVLTLAVNRQQRTPLTLPLDSIPMTLAGRRGSAGSIPSDQERAAGVSRYLLRRYAGDEAPFEVYVGYYDQQTQGKTIHSPKNCLPGSGWEALNQSTRTLVTAVGTETVNQYLLQNKQQRALVFYWYQGRGRVASNEYRVKWELLRDSALRGRSEEALVRIVVYLNAQTSETLATDWASRVATDLIPAVDRVLPRW
jgi:EpsI family protein